MIRCLSILLLLISVSAVGQNRFSKGDVLFSWSLEAQHLLESPSPSSEHICKIRYSEPLIVLDNRFGSISDKNLEALYGQCLFVQSGRSRGYIFDRDLSRFPSPRFDQVFFTPYDYASEYLNFEGGIFPDLPDGKEGRKMFEVDLGRDCYYYFDGYDCDWAEGIIIRTSAISWQEAWLMMTRINWLFRHAYIPMITDRVEFYFEEGDVWHVADLEDGEAMSDLFFGMDQISPEESRSFFVSMYIEGAGALVRMDRTESYWDISLSYSCD